MKAGDEFRATRAFTVEDVEAFTRVSGDRGAHHLQPDEHGRLMVHGLLTATLPTQIGGSLDFIARVMHLEYLRPVFTGDTVEAVAKIEEMNEGHLVISTVCTNQHGKVVLQGTITGVIR